MTAEFSIRVLYHWYLFWDRVSPVCLDNEWLVPKHQWYGHVELVLNMYINRNHLQPHEKCLNDIPMYCHDLRRWPILLDSFGMYDLRSILDCQNVSSTSIPCAPLYPDKPQAFHHYSVQSVHCDVGIKSLEPFPLNRKMFVIHHQWWHLVFFKNLFKLIHTCVIVFLIEPITNRFYTIPFRMDASENIIAKQLIFTNVQTSGTKWSEILLATLYFWKNASTLEWSVDLCVLMKKTIDALSPCDMLTKHRCADYIFSHL